MKRVLAPVALLFLAAMGSTARADDPGNPAAQALFDDAKRLMAEKNYAQACPKLEESNRLAPGAGTKFNLAECYERVGRTASAWASFLAAAAQTRSAGQKEREWAARDRAAALEPKLCRLAIVVPTAAPGMEIKRDGERVGQAQWGEAVPIDPGQHTVSATATGKRPWRATIEVVGSASTSKLLIPELDEEPAPRAAVTPATEAATPAREAAPARATNATLGYVLLGTGGAALVGGTIMWILRGSSISKLEAACGADGHACPATSTEDIAAGRTYTALGIGLFGLGALGVASGAGVLLLGGKAEAAPRARITPTSTGSAHGLAVSGRF